MAILIKNGLLIDPSNKIHNHLNLILENGRVSGITTDMPDCEQIVDASNRIVCPGFVDIHMHEDPVNQDGEIDFCIFDTMLRMGVTTAVGGNCGINVHDPSEYLDIVDRNNAPVNIALYAGHSYLRENAGATDRYGAISAKQLANLVRNVDHALDSGCVGVSFGLRYVPGTDITEFQTVVERCCSHHALISAHVRDDAENIFSAVDEVAQAGLRYGLPVQISHIGSMGGFGQMEKLLVQIESYRQNGLDIFCDCYPYFAFSTRIGETTYDDGWLERYHCDYSACMLTEGKYKGQRCTKEIFEETRRDFPRCITVCYVMKEEDIQMALSHPNVMVASDGLLDNGQGHPRAAGTFPRFFDAFVRNGQIDLDTGIAKMTSMPASRLGFDQKGQLGIGADADVVIFDPKTFRDCATFEDPVLPPLGIDAVFISGELALKNGVILRRDLGTSLRKHWKQNDA